MDPGPSLSQAACVTKAVENLLNESDDDVEHLIALLNVEPIGADLFRAASPVLRGRRNIFGGQVMAQALRAAGATVRRTGTRTLCTLTFFGKANLLRTCTCRSSAPGTVSLSRRARSLRRKRTGARFLPCRHLFTETRLGEISPRLPERYTRQLPRWARFHREVRASELTLSTEPALSPEQWNQTSRHTSPGRAPVARYRKIEC